MVRNGKPILEHDLTHATGGLPGYPAFDDGFRAGRVVIAPEPMRITRHGRARRRDGNPNGQSVYATGSSGIRYWFGHVANPSPVGTTVKRGERFATISSNHEAPHLHVGIDARPLIGHELKHHTDYTHGAPTVGAQLTRALAV